MLQTSLLLKRRGVLLLSNLIIVIGRRLRRGRHGIHLDSTLDPRQTTMQKMKQRIILMLSRLLKNRLHSLASTPPTTKQGTYLERYNEGKRRENRSREQERRRKTGERTGVFN
jgi:hypothetical protein